MYTRVESLCGCVRTFVFLFDVFVFMHMGCLYSWIRWNIPLYELASVYPCIWGVFWGWTNCIYLCPWCLYPCIRGVSIFVYGMFYPVYGVFILYTECFILLWCIYIVYERSLSLYTECFILYMVCLYYIRNVLSCIWCVYIVYGMFYPVYGVFILYARGLYLCIRNVLSCIWCVYIV